MAPLYAMRSLRRRGRRRLYALQPGLAPQRSSHDPFSRCRRLSPRSCSRLARGRKTSTLRAAASPSRQRRAASRSSTTASTTICATATANCAKVFDMKVTGTTAAMKAGDQKDAVAIATSALAHFACPEGQKGRLSNTPEIRERRLESAGALRLDHGRSIRSGGRSSHGRGNSARSRAGTRYCRE